MGVSVQLLLAVMAIDCCVNCLSLYLQHAFAARYYDKHCVRLHFCCKRLITRSMRRSVFRIKSKMETIDSVTPGTPGMLAVATHSNPYNPAKINETRTRVASESKREPERKVSVEVQKKEKETEFPEPEIEVAVAKRAESEVEVEIYERYSARL